MDARNKGRGKKKEKEVVAHALILRKRGGEGGGELARHQRFKHQFTGKGMAYLCSLSEGKKKKKKN